ncbi:hypothetical protein GCM10007276_07830 [Agaricicola taiwanensis]|uniref:DUF2076 domain-containing protein n=1 Tax=Agaricicola taiwanensis TaxID=591372 RepID=A0A8J2VJX9_9RHOB|nr:DUF2076 family protein [Agaricicola taiwanensis]GGE32998.1 hypothetical protein GCM10007276_07830 [Agaricicola taiwanensis]
MDRNDQQAIDSLFGKLSAVERQSPSRDPQSEDFIRERIAQQPHAPYYMAQTIVVQQQALEAAQARIEELEGRGQPQASASGGLFGGLLGSGRQPVRSSGSVPRVARGGEAQPASPWNQSQRGMGGGGFLAGAAQTAMGVAGGVLLGNAIAGMLGGGEAQAAETPAPAEEEPQADDAGFDDAGFDDNEF